MKKSTILGYLTPNNSRAARGREHWAHNAPWALRMREREAGAGASAGAGRWARALGRWALGRSVHGARCAGARRSARAGRGARCAVHGARCAVRGRSVHGARALGARCAGAGRSGARRSVHGARCAVRGALALRSRFARARYARARSRIARTACGSLGTGSRETSWSACPGSRRRQRCASSRVPVAISRIFMGVRAKQGGLGTGGV